ncbi:MAG TPA: DinB family protein [Ktedonobacterales bacterium]|nr:DinB family protein [Ktedonobacterales bacterium]
MTGDEILQDKHRERYVTLALADQITGDRWREPLLPGGRTIHELLSHILAWDEWAIGAFEISLLRELPASFRAALDDVDAFNGRATTRYTGLPREDILTGLQTASKRLMASATASGGAEWNRRKLLDLAPEPGSPRIPSVGGVLRNLTSHEASHHQEISESFGVHVDVDSGKNGNPDQS